MNRSSDRVMHSSTAAQQHSSRQSYAQAKLCTGKVMHRLRSYAQAKKLCTGKVMHSLYNLNPL